MVESAPSISRDSPMGDQPKLMMMVSLYYNGVRV